MDGPEFAETGCFGGADEFVGSAAEEVAAGLVAQRPPSGTVIGDANLEAGARISFLCLAEHVSERVDGQVLVQV